MSAPYDLAVNLPLRGPVAARLKEALAGLVTPDLLGYPSPGGGPDVREAIACWTAEACGHDRVDPSLVAVTLGGRHALTLALPFVGDAYNAALMMEDLTYPGVRAGAQALGIRCVDVAMDADGMKPDALESAAKRSGSRTVYIQPTLHNPTTITMPWRRRCEIADVAERLDLFIIESDVYSPLAWQTEQMLPSFLAMIPHRTVHVGGIGKVLGPGMRVGWIVVPDDRAYRLVTEKIRLDTDGLPALFPSLVARWMADGTALAFTAQLAAHMVERGRLARWIVGNDLVVNGAGLHAWLPTRDALGLEKRCREAGVRVGVARGYVGTRKPVRGVRLSLAAEENPARLETALRIVAGCR